MAAKRPLDVDPARTGPVVSQLRIAQRLAARAHALLAYVDDVVAVTGTDGRFQYVSPAAVSVFGYDTRTLLELDGIGALAHPLDVHRVHSAYQQARQVPGATARASLRARHRAGGVVHLEMAVTNLLADPGVEGMVLVVRDVTERRESEWSLTRHALYDSLTGLPNRTLLLDRLHQALKRRAAERDRVALLFLDLDHFKDVNDRFGHAAGDTLLVEIAKRLARAVRAPDTVARLAGDEFVVLCLLPHDGKGIGELPDRLMDTIAAPVRIGTDDDAAEMRMSASIGVVVADTDRTPEDLLADADSAMYRAKEAGRARVEAVAPGAHRAARGRLTTEASLRHAIGRGELSLVYQPAFDLTTRRVTGFEALVRWNHPERGLLGPSEFVPLAEETGLVAPMGAWVIETACADAARLAGPARLGRRVWVNVAASQLAADPDLGDRVRAALSRTGVAPAQLGIELTETSQLGEGRDGAATIDVLHARGVGIALDDFGMGYSSLVYLRRLPVDVLKIDRSFVVGITRERRTALIVRGVVELAHALGLRVVAEGVETTAQLAAARAAGCDRAQGNLLAPPLPLAELGRFLARPGRPVGPSAGAA